jgi:hypothetical protein
MYSDVMMYDDVPNCNDMPSFMSSKMINALWGLESIERVDIKQHTHVLFKIDECYKIIINIKNVIDMHKIVYGDNIICEYINMDPLMNTFKITDEYGFFVNDTHDINIIKDTIDNCYKQVVEFKKIFAPKQEPTKVNIEKLAQELVPQQMPMREPKFSNLRDYDYKADELSDYGTPLYKNKYSGNIKNNSKLHFKTIKTEKQYNTMICFNKYFYNVVMLSEKDICISDLEIMFPELKLVQSIFIENDDIMNDIQAKIEHMTEVDIINENINNVMNNYSSTKKYPDRPTFDSIKNYIQSVYKITSYIEDKIQFSVILDRVCKEMQYHIDEKRSIANKILPLVLKDLGLNKKRYAQGVFWYGLVEEKEKQPMVLKPVKNFSIRIRENGIEEYITEFNMKVEPISETESVNKLNEYLSQRNDFVNSMTPESREICNHNTFFTMLNNNEPTYDLNLADFYSEKYKCV